MVFRIAALSALMAIVLTESNPRYSLPVPAYNAPAPAPSGPVQYNFNYVVENNIGNDSGHEENRNRYDSQGTFFVQLPDGRLQTVTYNVNGDSGFVADVAYQGEAQYPAQQPARSYQPASTPAYG
ncbi:uncharacterized protein LOC134787407 [Penaeus indicus]|uniref:uncharacterized protein LOC134787407 n=1 Tax=Penaeus indicus TaxID=29960 RepID=UPI00300C2AC8